jgi:hypothetical protein
MAHHHLLPQLRKLLLAHSRSTPTKPLTMEIVVLILANIVAAFLLFLAMAGFVIWLPVPTARKHVDIPRKDELELDSLEPYPLRPIEGKPKYKMNMGLRRLDRVNWLTIDKNFLPQHLVRSELLSREKNRVLRCLAGSEAACAEALEVVVEHLTQRYPNAFRMSRRNGKVTVCITATGETFQVSSPYGGMSPLEIAARLSMEDLNVLIQHRKDAEYFLYASSSQTHYDS